MSRGFYERRVFPFLNDVLGRSSPLQELRQQTLIGASGRVIDIGFGSGANLPHYPGPVSEVVGVEPNDGMTDRAVPNARTAAMRVSIVEGMAESLPFADATFDTAVSTLTLCSVQRPERVLAELHRVLRRDGAFFVLEHGLAPDPGVARWQHRLNPLQQLFACGCNLDRPTLEMVSHAGFVFDRLKTFFVPGVPRPLGWLTAGRAVKAQQATGSSADPSK